VNVAVPIRELARWHPALFWEFLAPAVVATLAQGGRQPPYPFSLSVRGIPGHEADELELLLDPTAVSEDWVERIRNTMEPSRLVEAAAIAIACVGLHFAGGHRIEALAIRGTGADYVVGPERHHLEIAGRTRRKDLNTTLEQKRLRFQELGVAAYYIGVAEFETFTGLLAFFPD
jgi:hypothetical protein